ncbi:cytochrome P450 [Roseofilum reptotaenium CS-1145]|uniref:Cytochrome n=1 Tax=Roseofilum reptotaenium AO1-A TaxID=1925591 RepID=A0A1L9QWN3_9CYAN|nr:cytochrome P450 [Roseofilum reptotaenium]MDB9518583.1 cytochrome P450 [Roseofilum reptotaenium CS-1145]OJJ27022.1 hypothetical protein BI308_02910 [Roseofilum reptotaenium AO1-A]
MMEFNPRNAAFRANPYPVYDRLRATDPIHYRQSTEDWILTRYADIVTLLKDNRIDPRDGVEPLGDRTEPHPQDLQTPQDRQNPLLDRFLHLREESQRLRQHWIIVTNPPQHDRLQKVLNPGFTHQKISRLEPHLQMMADRAIDKVLASGNMDIIEDFAYPLVVEAISELLGIPVEDRQRLVPLAREIALSIDLNKSQTTYERGQFALTNLTQYFRKLISQLLEATEPQDNLMGTMLHAQAQGELSEDELLANSTFLFFTGQGSNHHIIGNGMLALLRHPEQLRLLQNNSTLMKTAIDECLRYDGPGQYIIRRPLADIEIGGQTIRKGEKMILVIGAANRDPEQFLEPDKFDICRQPNPYLTFGYGMRSCMGSRLAKLVARIGVGTLISRLPKITLANENPEWEESYKAHGLKSLQVLF